MAEEELDIHGMTVQQVFDQEYSEMKEHCITQIQREIDDVCNEPDHPHCQARIKAWRAVISDLRATGGTKVMN